MASGPKRHYCVMVLAFQPPLDPMLARLKEEIPKGEGWLYEPKWDGFRALVFAAGDSIEMFSRDRKPLGRYFPELLPALTAALPAGAIADGEIVITGGHGLEFDSLLQRIHPAASRIALLAEQTPASFVIFDLMGLGEDDLRSQPLATRREKLHGIFGKPQLPSTGRGTNVTLTPQTSDFDEASEWFIGLESLGLDGLIAKQAGAPYSPGERTMVKIKHRRTADCVVGGYRLSKSKDGVGSLLLGLYDDEGTLHLVGHTSSFKAAERRDLLQTLKPLEKETGFEGGRAPGGPSRWAAQKDQSWVPLDPVLVCEVSYEYMQGVRFRHATRLLRWRDDKGPRACTLDQVLVSRG